MERYTVYFIAFFSFGIWSFFWGFKRLRRRRLIENIPTSTIRGLALGLVELTGRAKKENLFKSPFTNTDCVLYRYTVERYEQRGKSSRWVTVADGNTFYSPFWLDDGTGSILVFPKDAELILPMDYEFTSGLFKSIPSNLVDFMENSGIAYKAFLGSYQMRFREWYIRQGENTYVLGSANKANDFLESRNEILLKRLGELKNDAVFMKEADTNKDGNISQEEWSAAVSKIEQDIVQKELEKGQNTSTGDVIISKTDSEKVFIISNHSQKELVHKLGMQAIMGIFGGCILALAMLYFIFASFWFN